MTTRNSFILFILLLTTNSSAENYLLNGGQKSEINYRMVQQIKPTKETVMISLSFVEPQNFTSPTYSQTIQNFSIASRIKADKIERFSDMHGNKVVKYIWQKPRESFDVLTTFTAVNKVSLAKIETSAPFPVSSNITRSQLYTKATDLVQSDSDQIINKARELTRGAKTQFDAVQKVLSWVIDHMHYVLNPNSYDAINSLKNAKGNCQNYSHLAAALLRANGIPVRIVNGITLKRPYDVKIGKQIMTLNMAQGRHAWIEVYFPDLGWMPFDPQQSELFVSNRFIRVEIGRDNAETENDGLVNWTRQKGAQSVISFQETIETEFSSDEVNVSGKKQAYGPKKLLLVPDVSAGYTRITPTPPVVKPMAYDQKRMAGLKFTKQNVTGNLDFPAGVNFALTHKISGDKTTQDQTLKPTFLVETAEYVTGKKEFCQVFILDKPTLLQNISMALQKFGGTGQIWLELREDNNGAPGAVAARSSSVSMSSMPLQQGYQWVDFDFSKQGLGLTPDRYWISLGYEGAPIVNWFYSYGKSVGPIDGTRYRLSGEKNWDKSLSYEFNYRVTGLIPAK